MSSIEEFVKGLSAGKACFTTTPEATCAALSKHAGSADELYDLYDKDTAAFSALLRECGLVPIARVRVRQAFNLRSRLRASKRSRSPAPEEEQRQRPKTVLPPQIMSSIKEFVYRLSAGNAYFTTMREATCTALEKHAGSPDKLYDLYDKDIAAFSALLHEWGLVSIAITRIRQAFKVRSQGGKQ